MGRKSIYSPLAKLIELIHLFVIPTYFASVFALFLSPVYKIHAALFMASFWISNKVFKGCALTKLENRLLMKSGRKAYDRIFLENIFHKYLNKEIRVPKTLADKVVFFFFLISSFVLIKYYF